MANYISQYTGTQIDTLLGKANTALQPNTAITGATKTKITYDANGLVTSGADLEATDIPSLNASKITEGTFADARIASASTWNAKANTPTWVTSYTLASSSWSSKTYSLESAYPFASYDVEISISPSATETQRDAYAEAMMTGSPSSNVITALGDAPTVDIPCYLQVRAK